MSNNNKTPAIRFKGFTDTWEQRKLGEISESFEYGLNAAATEYDGKHKYIRITDIDDSTHLFLQDDLTSPDIDFSTADDYLLQEGDVLFARTGASVGKTYIYRRSDGDLYFAGFLIRAKIKSDYDANFVFQNTLTDSYDSYIRITSKRSGQPGVNAQEYANFALSVPSLAEQKKIGAYFSHLDTLITLHQRKCDKLIQFKAAMLQKMFPQNGADKPEIRFKGFTDAWEHCKLNSIADVRDGTHASPQYFSSGHPFITSKNVKDGYINYDDVQYISDEDYEEINKRSKVDVNDILMGMIGTIGNLALIREEPDFAIKNVALIKDTGDIFYLYLYHYLQSETVLNQLLENMDGGTQKFVALKRIRELNIAFPIKSEQQAIGTYFHNLDSVITLHQRKCDKYKSIKAGLIRKLFP